MDLPRPPDDPEIKNIIDKLSMFVARNGPEFEQVTKNKQEGNPKFSFLYGGENYDYYTIDWGVTDISVLTYSNFEFSRLVLYYVVGRQKVTLNDA